MKANQDDTTPNRSEAEMDTSEKCPEGERSESIQGPSGARSAEGDQDDPADCQGLRDPSGAGVGVEEGKRLSSPCWRQRRWRRSEVGRRQSVPVGKPSVERWPEGPKQLFGLSGGAGRRRVSARSVIT
jgi:hypothetical protein